MNNTMDNLGTIGVGAIKVGYTQFSLQNLLSKINNLLFNHPDVEVIVTPEYTFYGFGGYNDYRNESVIVNCGDGFCSVSSSGTNKSNELKGAIETLQNVASVNKVNIVLGTIAERINIDSANFTVDTQLIIDNNGHIIGKNTMYNPVYSFQNGLYDCGGNITLCEKIRVENNLETRKGYTLKDSEGHSFEVISLICGDKANPKIIDKLRNSNVSLIIGSDMDTDFNYEDMMNKIQIGDNPFKNPTFYSGEWFFKDIYLNKWINNGIIKRNGYFLVSEGAIPTAGIINWDMSKIQDLDVTEDYVYGKIEVPRK